MRISDWSSDVCSSDLPRVIAACGLDPDDWQGFAFGCGLDRLAMLKSGMTDLRAFFDADLRWLKHYGFSSLDVPTLLGGVGDCSSPFPGMRHIWGQMRRDG